MDKPTTQQHTYSNRKKFIALGVAIAVLIVIVIGLLFVLQSPERQLANGFANFTKASSIGVNGTIAATSNTGAGSGGTYTWKIDGKTNKEVATATAAVKYTDGSKTKLDGTIHAIVVDKNTIYLKVDDPAKFMGSFAEVVTTSVPGGNVGSIKGVDIAGSIRTTMTQIGANMKDKWVKVSSDQFKSMFGGGSTSTSCYAKFADTLKTDTKARNELASAYTKYQFVNIDSSLPAEGSSQGYRVTIDQAKLKEFRDSVGDNAAVKQLGECGESILTLGASDSLNDQTADIWVDRFSHDITHIKYDKVSATGSSTVDLHFDYDMSVSASAPEQVIDLQKVFPTL